MFLHIQRHQLLIFCMSDQEFDAYLCFLLLCFFPLISSKILVFVFFYYIIALNQSCLQCFTSPRMLEYQIRNFPEINNTKSVLLPEGNAYVNFQNIRRIIKAPWIIYSDFKWILIPLTDKSDDGPNTEKYQNHIVCCMSVN